MIKAWKLSEEINKSNPKVFFLVGDDFYIKKQAVNEITSDIKNRELNYEVYEEDFEIDDLLKSVSVYPIFDNCRAVLIRSDKITDNIVTELTEKASDTTLLIFSVMNGEKIKKSLPYGTAVDCLRADDKIAESFILNSFTEEGYTIDEETVKLIKNKCGSYLGKINNEIIKLKSYFYESKVIDGNIVGELINVNSEYEVFELSKALLAKNIKCIAEVKNTLLSDGKAPAALLGLITSQFRRMLHSTVSELSISEIAAKLNVKPYSIEMAQREGGKMPQIRIKKILDYLESCEFRFKKGQISDKNALDLAIDYIIGI